jgi:hypothetical protein
VDHDVPWKIEERSAFGLFYDNCVGHSPQFTGSLRKRQQSLQSLRASRA